MRELNECIASRAFASLILDYEFSDYVSCRVLIEDLLDGRIHAATSERITGGPIPPEGVSENRNF